MLRVSWSVLFNIFEIFFKVFVLQLVYLWCFRVIQGLFCSDDEQTISKTYQNIFVIFNISLQLCANVSLICYRMCS